MAIKIDFEKAYDRLRWSFIRHSLLELRIPQVMLEVIMHCICSTSLHILWNGEQTNSFKPTRGIRQGDPLSPYIYVICMERLTHLIENSIQIGAWKPKRASRNGPKLSNLAFADDLILFGEASTNQAKVIMACLDQFCEMSGSKVSVAKSRVFFSRNTDENTRRLVCEELRINGGDRRPWHLSRCSHY